MAKMYDKYNRFTKKAAKIVVKLLKKGKFESGFVRSNGEELDNKIVFDPQPNTSYPYRIGQAWYTEKLHYCMRDEDLDENDIVGFVSDTDKELFERKFNEKYNKDE
jgi:hypothetical protein|nr:MAG TPA: hypothetical protein [Caudoviricetes sp.]